MASRSRRNRCGVGLGGEIIKAVDVALQIGQLAIFVVFNIVLGRGDLIQGIGVPAERVGLVQQNFVVGVDVADIADQQNPDDYGSENTGDVFPAFGKFPQIFMHKPNDTLSLSHRQGRWPPQSKELNHATA